MSTDSGHARQRCQGVLSSQLGVSHTVVTPQSSCTVRRALGGLPVQGGGSGPRSGLHHLQALLLARGHIRHQQRAAHHRHLQPVLQLAAHHQQGARPACTPCKTAAGMSAALILRPFLFFCLWDPSTRATKSRCRILCLIVSPGIDLLARRDALTTHRIAATWHLAQGTAVALTPLPAWPYQPYSVFRQRDALLVLIHPLETVHLWPSSHRADCSHIIWSPTDVA